MKFSDAYRTIYKSRGYTQQQLADVLGIRQSSVSSFLKKGNPSVDTLIGYLAPLGYEVALVPVGTRLPDRSTTLSPSDGERDDGIRPRPRLYPHSGALRQLLSIPARGNRCFGAIPF